MEHPLIELIEAKIRDAEADGSFDNLAGAGKPLADEDDPENALLGRLMRESGASPEFVSLGRELKRLRAELAATGAVTAWREIMKEMSIMEVRIALARQAWKR